MEVKREKLLPSKARVASAEGSLAKQHRASEMLRGVDLSGTDLDKYVEERVLTTTLEKALNWGRANAMWPATFGLACCAIEMMSIVTARYDSARFGAEVFRASPRQADMLILSGRVSIKMAPPLRRIYDQMLEPKWVIAMGACASSAGVFNNYALVQGADKFMPVDIHVPGCPPRPEALLHGIMRLQERIRAEESGLGGVERIDPLSVDGRDAVAALTAPPVTPPPGVVVPSGVVWHRSARPGEGPAVGPEGRLPLTELTVDRAGAPAPFGDDQALPLPPDQLDYQHPSGGDRQ